MTLVKEWTAGKLPVKVYGTRQEMGRSAASEAASHIKDLLSEKDEVAIIFAAAPSQNEFLEALTADKAIEWNRVHAFHMDEYIGLEPEAPQGFGNFLRDRIFGRLNFKSVNYLNGHTGDVKEECSRYADLLRKYPTDIVCMGIGENGHIAFNDPHVAFFNDDKLVKVVELDERCRMQQVNDGCFASLDQVPTHALTLTIPALMAAKAVFCMVPAKTKAEAVYAAVEWKISEACPASILRTHENAVLYTDTDSAARLLGSEVTQ